MRTFLVLALVLTLSVPLSTLTLPARATSWASSVALPGTDPNVNLFPSLLQTSNSSAGQGATWLVWEKSSTSSSGQVYLMTHDRFGWSGQTAIVKDSNDNIAPTLAELANGTIILVWSRGTGAYGTYDLYWMGYNGTRWTSISPLVQGNRDNYTPALTRTSDGKVWLVWSRSNSTNGGGDIFYKTYNGIWSSPKALVATPASEKFPAVSQTSDGKVWVYYTSNAGGNDQLWDVIWNGASWSSPAKFTNTSNPDDYPSMVQDRSGVLWTFWTRQLPTNDPANPIQADLFYKNSTNLGSSWGPEVQIAIPTTTKSDEFHPTAAQSSDKTLWVVYASNQAINNPYGTFNLYLLQSSLIPGHDLAVTYVKTLGGYGTSSTNPRAGEMATVYVTVTNLGDFTDTSTVTAYVNSTQIGLTSTTLTPGQIVTFSFSWNSTGSPIGRYQALATVAPVPGEVVTQNNNLSFSFLLVPRGDVNRDGRVNIVDLALIAVHFGSQIGDPNYWVEAELSHDGKIDIRDLSICGISFGQSV